MIRVPSTRFSFHRCIVEHLFVKFIKASKGTNNKKAKKKKKNTMLDLIYRRKYKRKNYNGFEIYIENEFKNVISVVA